MARYNPLARLPSTSAFRASPYQVNRLIAGKAVNSMANMTAISLNDIMKQINKGAMEGVSEELRIFAQAWKFRWTRRPGLDKTHKTVAASAQKTIRRSYAQAHRHSPRDEQYERASDPNPKYRRYANGVLFAALGRPEMAVGTYDGVSLIHTSILFKAAKQWYRLNFGAGGVGSSPLKGAASRAAFNLTLFGSRVGTYSLSAFAPRGPFEIPRGLFIGGSHDIRNARSSASFVPLSWMKNQDASKLRKQVGRGSKAYPSKRYRTKFNSRVKPQERYLYVDRHITRGIRPSGFIDRGLGTLVREIGPAWEQIFIRWVEEAKTGTKPSNPVVKAGVSPAQAGNILRAIT